MSSYFIIKDGQLLSGKQKVTHILRRDGGGEEYLKLWVSDGKVLCGRTIGDEMFTLKVTPDGELEGEVPGGYEYIFIAGGEE